MFKAKIYINASVMSFYANDCHSENYSHKLTYKMQISFFNTKNNKSMNL